MLLSFTLLFNLPPKYIKCHCQQSYSVHRSLPISPYIVCPWNQLNKQSPFQRWNMSSTCSPFSQTSSSSFWIILLTTCAAAHSLGCSGLKVSKVILGAMSYGSSEWAPWVLNEDEALPLLKAAFDRGINTWDTGEFLPVTSERCFR